MAKPPNPCLAHSVAHPVSFRRGIVGLVSITERPHMTDTAKLGDEQLGEILKGFHKALESLQKVTEVHSVQMKRAEKVTQEVQQGVEILGATLVRCRHLDARGLLLALTDASVAEISKGNAISARILQRAAAPLNEELE